ncbi:hypothetical protein HanRHA438_Chr05g0230531 [Helianthus annuus]|nr:hypothetical protein HanRHA438_Chr05g0230531 [Helianthus annuus]
MLNNSSMVMVSKSLDSCTATITDSIFMASCAVFVVAMRSNMVLFTA